MTSVVSSSPPEHPRTLTRHRRAIPAHPSAPTTEETSAQPNTLRASAAYTGEV
jgi:hypothetical protein